ncbi:MAG: DUF5131 family protein [Pseudodesulfovibrio sp.]|uniref:DUF5131 family protein n=1 Tax=Pseudodesulfovibrio sp. TaxID=2035812 RepID=UPI003D09AF41
MSTKIEWTDKTWNPIVGCSKVSPACDHCYAEKMAFRLAHNPKAPIEYRNVVTDAGTWNGKTALVESTLGTPLHWRKPCRVFVGSMTDLFHEDTPDEWIGKVFATMALSSHITFQVLTKRPERMHRFINGIHNTIGVVDPRQPDGPNDPVLVQHVKWPLPNVWLGVTVENQEQADKRIPILLDTPAAVRFVSVEPMLGPVDLEGVGRDLNALEGVWAVKSPGENNEYDIFDTPALDWVICGGETGPGARPMWEPWARDLMEQCEADGIPFFFKKWGAYRGPDDWKIPAGDKIGGRIIREFPEENGGSGDES